MRAGVEIVIGNMCLRQTKQKKVCLMKVVLCACVCVCVQFFFVCFFFYLCHSMKYKLEKLQDALLSNLQESDKYSSLISCCFVCLVAAHMLVCDVQIMTVYIQKTDRSLALTQKLVVISS